MDDFGHIQVGTVMELRNNVLGNKIGEIGVCYSVEEIQGRFSYGFIFPNGRYDGFSPNEVYQFFNIDSNFFIPEIHLYEFENVIQLSKDFYNGRFKKAWV